MYLEAQPVSLIFVPARKPLLANVRAPISTKDPLSRSLFLSLAENVGKILNDSLVHMSFVSYKMFSPYPCLVRQKLHTNNT